MKYVWVLSCLTSAILACMGGVWITSYIPPGPARTIIMIPVGTTAAFTALAALAMLRASKEIIEGLRRSL